MKTVFAAVIASMLAVPVLAPSAQAASVTVSTDGVYVKDSYRHDRWRRHHRAEWRHHEWRRHHQRHCRTRVSKHWWHHKLVVRRVRVCD